jgi:GT2 family glycosyltransferase
MPFHRVLPALPVAAESVLRQTLSDVELIAVDNGTGQGARVLGSVANDSRVRVVSLPENRGISRGRNAGIAAARGELIALLDYDDVAWPQRFERQVEALRRDPTLGLVGAHADKIDADGRRVGWEFTLAGRDEPRTFLRYTMPASTSTLMGRRDVFENFPFRPSLDLAEDFDFVSRVSERAGFAVLAEPLISYRHYPGQTTRERFAGQMLLAAFVRLLSARRRAGRDEGMEALLANYPEWLQRAPALDAVHAEFARRCAREGFPDLAVYHARKLLSARRDPVALALALRLWLAAMRQAPRQGAFLTHLFWRGPLRAHRLRPLGASVAG